MQDYFKIQDAIVFSTTKFAGIEATKPTLLHSVRCGISLMNSGFTSDVVIAGILHDILEDTDTTAEEIVKLFGNAVAKIVVANTKDDEILDKNSRREELIKRCCLAGGDAIVVKLTDIYDNYLYYKKIDNYELVRYCHELKSYVKKYIRTEDYRVDYIKSTLDKIK